MAGSQVKVGGRNGTNTPVGLGGECGSLIVGGGGRDDLVAVNVYGSRCRCRQLRLFFGLLLNLSNLLTLL